MRSIPAFCALLFMVASANAARAEDGKVYPASMCQAVNATHAARAEYTGNGRVCNTSNSSLTLRCPIVRDTIAGAITYFRLYAKNANPSQDITCVLRTLKPNTEDGWGWYQSITIGLSQFNDPDAWQSWHSYANMGEQADGPYELSCTLPPVTLWSGQNKQSCLGAYRVDEQ